MENASLAYEPKPGTLERAILVMLRDEQFPVTTRKVADEVKPFFPYMTRREFDARVKDGLHALARHHLVIAGGVHFPTWLISEHGRTIFPAEAAAHA